MSISRHKYFRTCKRCFTPFKTTNSCTKLCITCKLQNKQYLNSPERKEYLGKRISAGKKKWGLIKKKIIEIGGVMT